MFSRFGLAVIDSIPVAESLPRMAGMEATTADAPVLIDIALRLFGAGLQELAAVAASHPVLSAAAVSAVLWFCHKRGYLRGPDWRQRPARLRALGQPLLEQGRAAPLEHASLSDSLIVVEAPAFPNGEQLAARYLARCGRPLTPGELRDALARDGHQIPAARLKREMSAHRAFVRSPGDLWTVGRPAAG
ncbi:hypothetical protein ACFVHB_36065 [Kitasatospora sp. NPDC127111]|uniref:hypothetical protein n=1 Tax=Kitasatospora sp. NPDC127111 TaxID=3345363 RepID=UPI00363EA27C